MHSRAGKEKGTRKNFEFLKSGHKSLKRISRTQTFRGRVVELVLDGLHVKETARARQCKETQHHENSYVAPEKPPATAVPVQTWRGASAMSFACLQDAAQSGARGTRTASLACCVLCDVVTWDHCSSVCLLDCVGGNESLLQ